MSVSPADAIVFPRCSPSSNKHQRSKKKKKRFPSDNERTPSGILVDLSDMDSGVPAEESVLKAETPYESVYVGQFPTVSCSSEASSSSGASSSTGSSKDGRRMFAPDMRNSEDSKIGSRDSKIEIAGGREIFSQSKSRSGRQRRSGGKRHYHHHHIHRHHQKEEEEEEEDEEEEEEEEERSRPKGSSSSGSRGAPTQVLRETVFSSEIHSIEYHRPLIPSSPVDEIIPEKTNQDVNVTYDLIDGIFAPPSGLVVRSEGAPLTTDLLSHTPTGELVDTLYLGEEASGGRKTPSSVMIGGVAIAEYEGSPRRYKPRKSPPLKTTKASSIRRKVGSSNSSSTTSSTSSLAGLRGSVNKLPGFPQRILPPQPPINQEDRREEPKAEEEQEELLRFDELPPPTEKECAGATDYSSRYEFSETRKVLEEFFKDTSPTETDLSHSVENVTDDFGELNYTLKRRQTPTAGNYVGHKLASSKNEGNTNEIIGSLLSPTANQNEDLLCGNVAAPVVGLSPLDPVTAVQSSIANGFFNNASNTTNGGGRTSSPEILSGDNRHLEEHNGIENSRNFTLSPETTDCDSADLESEVSVNEGSVNSSGTRIHLPVLEDGLSSGHASDLDDDVIYSSSGNVLLKKPSASSSSSSSQQQQQQQQQHFQEVMNKENKRTQINNNILNQQHPRNDFLIQNNNPSSNSSLSQEGCHLSEIGGGGHSNKTEPFATSNNNNNHLNSSSSKLSVAAADESVAAALKDIKMAIQAARVLQTTRIPNNSTPSEIIPPPPPPALKPVEDVLSSSNVGGVDPWILRQNSSPTPPLTDYDPENSAPSSSVENSENFPSSHKKAEIPATSNGNLAAAAVADDEEEEEEEDEPDEEEEVSEIGEERVPTPKAKEDDDLDTDQETDRLLGQQYNDDNGYYDTKNEATKKKSSKSKEALSDPKVLIEGVLFRARYLGSTQLVCEGQPTKATRMMQAEEAVSRIKAPDGENQPSTEVDLFISTEKIMVLNTDLKEIMMDHALRSISYIADIGDILVIMARRRIIPSEGSGEVIGSTPKMICHVFESEEAQFIAQSIGQAFQVAYMEFLKANGIEDHSFVKEMDYQEVLNSQEIFGDELAMFAKKELQKEVVVPKTKGEILGVVIVESGWGSMLPTIVLANLSPTGPAARCGHLNIGDQIIAINGISLVGLPLSTCQHYIKNTKNKTAVKLTAVSCAPVVEVKIKRPDTKYQLGFSVQNGVICSLLRGGIAERGGVRVGHRIIEINGQSVVAVPHERIVNLLATSVGEITMKTMPTSMFRLLTGQETPLYI